MLYNLAWLLFAWGCTSLVLGALWAVANIIGRYRYERGQRRKRRP